MKVQFESEKPLLVFDNLRIGDVFKCAAYVYIKINEAEALQVEKSVIKEIDLDVSVEPLEAVLVIKKEK